jgi:REP element-mobilizing transposase RayT
LPRRKRNWHPHAYYHVSMRGNNRQNIFQTEEDITELMRILEYGAAKDHFTMLAFCIMSNHYHFLIRSEYIDLAKVMGVSIEDTVTIIQNAILTSDGFTRKDIFPNKPMVQMQSSPSAATSIAIQSTPKFR